MEREAASMQKPETTGSRRSKLRDSLEVVIAFILILAVIWSPRPLQRSLWIVAVAGVALIIWESFDGWKPMGFTGVNLLRSLWIPCAALGAAAVAVAIAAHLHALFLPQGGLLAFTESYIAYAIWTCVQQFLLQGFFLLRLLSVAPRPALAALAAAGLFAAAHLPNPVLTPITLLWGFVACLLFLRYRNIYPLMLAHAILGIAVAVAVPGPVDHNMRVGLGYLTYKPHVHRLHGHLFVEPKSTQP
jgi:hypothetical protein